MDMFGDDLRISSGLPQMKEEAEDDDMDHSIFRSQK